jgi:hypothetical protein
MQNNILSDFNYMQAGGIAFGIFTAAATIAFSVKGAIKFNEIVENSILQFKNWEPDDVNRIKIGLPLMLLGMALLVSGVAYAFFSISAFIIGVATVAMILTTVGGVAFIIEMGNKNKNPIIERRLQGIEAKVLPPKSYNEARLTYKGKEETANILKLDNLTDVDLLDLCKNFPNIESLELVNCVNLTDTGLEELCKLSNLKNLVLRQVASLSPSTSEPLTKLPKMYTQAGIDNLKSNIMNVTLIE